MQTETIIEKETGSADHNAAVGKYLSFDVASESYGVDILRVREIRGWSRPTRIPGAPEHVLGVLNLRGSIVPVIDIRRRFGMPDMEVTQTTVIIVLTVQQQGEQRDVGIVVDAVSDVFDVSATQLRPPPELNVRIDVHCLNGIVTRDDEMIVLIDVDQLLDIAEIESLTE